jgi:hypothetical protein
MNYEMYKLYMAMVTERHKIWLARQAGESQPWTEDPVLANMKMTNMFRVLDPGSQFVFRLDNGARDQVDLISRLILYRLTNKPSTWDVFTNMLGRYPYADDFIYNSAVLYQMLDEYRRAGNAIFSGAYIIIPEPGTSNDKVDGALRVTARFVKEKAEAFISANSPDAQFTILRSTPGLGKFLSMQILTDWQYLQTEEPDLSFVVAGPGSARGAALISLDLRPEDVIYNLAFEWCDNSLVTLRGRTLTLMDVQNTFCEFSKYVREGRNPRKKSGYRPAHPGLQPKPILPHWW